MVFGSAANVAETSLVAWIGLRCIPGFDVRGPFLLMSPLFASSLFLIFVAGKCAAARKQEGIPKRAETNLVQETAREFGFGEVELQRVRSCDDLKLAIVNASGDPFELPKDWSTYGEMAKRFAVVRVLAGSDHSLASSYLENWRWCLALAVGMLAAGTNLWLILGCHLLFAAWMAYSVAFRRDQATIRRDERALRIMRDLPAAIAFVEADLPKSDFDAPTNVRIAALRRTAMRLGIA